MLMTNVSPIPARGLVVTACISIPEPSMRGWLAGTARIANSSSAGAWIVRETTIGWQSLVLIGYAFLIQRFRRSSVAGRLQSDDEPILRRWTRPLNNRTRRARTGAGQAPAPQRRRSVARPPLPEGTR